MTITAIIQARMTSTRLPGKVLLPLGDGCIVGAVLDRVSAVEAIEHVCLAVPDGGDHDPLEAFARQRTDTSVVRGSEHDVLSRISSAAREANATIVVRVTSDCPLIDPAVIATVLAAFRTGGAAFASTAFESGYPTGYDVEVFSRAALEVADRESVDAYEREHVTPYIWRKPERFHAIYIDHKPNLRGLRLVVDTPEDYRMAVAVWSELGGNPLFGLRDILGLRERRPDIFSINSLIKQKPYVGLPTS